jgi:hypothetical protein
MRFGLLAATFVCFAGCADDKLQEVSGTVTYDGAPLPAGVIWFDPDPNHPANPPQGYAYIKDGKFDTLNKGRGVRPGAYLVRVEGFDGKPGNELPMGKPLFTDFGEKREFPSSARVEIEVAIPKTEKPAKTAKTEKTAKGK